MSKIILVYRGDTDLASYMICYQTTPCVRWLSPTTSNEEDDPLQPLQNVFKCKYKSHSVDPEGKVFPKLHWFQPDMENIASNSLA